MMDNYFLELISLLSSLAAFRIGDQRAISAFTKLLNFAGVRSPCLEPIRRDWPAWPSPHGGPAANDLIGGQIDYMCLNMEVRPP